MIDVSSFYAQHQQIAKRLRIVAIAGVAVILFTFGISGIAFANPSPNGPGQPGAPETTCGNTNASVTPGASVSANGSAFNPDGVAGTVYAGNPNTASYNNSNSVHAVSQYDIACFQVTQNQK